MFTKNFVIALCLGVSAAGLMVPANASSECAAVSTDWNADLDWTLCDDVGSEAGSQQAVESDPVPVTASLPPLGPSSSTASSSDPGTHDELCQYNKTHYSEGGQTNGIYGVDSSLGAYAYTKVTSAGPYHKTGSAHATAGHRMTFAGSLPTVSGRIEFAWHMVGELLTATQCSNPASCTTAQGRVRVSIGVVDETTGQQAPVQVAIFEKSGNSTSGNPHQDHYTYPNRVSEVAVTFVSGRTYRPFIKVETDAEVLGQVLTPGLIASATVNYFRPQTPSLGSYLTWVRYWFTLPDGYTINCGVDPA